MRMRNRRSCNLNFLCPRYNYARRVVVLFQFVPLRIGTLYQDLCYFWTATRVLKKAFLWNFCYSEKRLLKLSLTAKGKDKIIRKIRSIDLLLQHWNRWNNYSKYRPECLKQRGIITSFPCSGSFHQVVVDNHQHIKKLGNAFRRNG